MTDDAPPRSGRGRWVVIGLALLGVAALAFAIGRFTMFGNAAGPATPGTDSPEAGFSRDMQVHHAQAVDMAMEIYRKTDDDELRVLAYDIATAQSGQKGELYDWLVQWGLPQNGGPLMSWMTGTDAAHGSHGSDTGEQKTDAELRAEMGMATDAELAELAAADGTAADCLFLGLMIRHHQGALPMADALLDLGTDPRALVLAKGVKDSQSVEIGAMESMKLRLGCTTG